jgi:Ca2+-binding RTX toxin-like protein
MVALMIADARGAILETTGAVAVGDFDGDGTPELVVGSPEAYCGKGMIYVLTPATPAIAIWTRDSTGILGVAACNDTFGAALAAGDFDGDGRDDLAIGVAGAADAGPTFSGSVHILYGSSTGLTDAGDQIWHQDSSGVEGVAEANDFFGDTLEVGDFSCDGYADLAIGVPRETVVTSSSDEGAVHVLYGSSSGLSNVDDVWYQGVDGVDDTPEVNDRFGASLARANLNGDDEDGVGCDDLVIGAPYESVGSVAGSGWIYTIDGGAAGLSTTGDQAFHQDTTDVVDTAEAYDFFGWRLGSTRIDDDGYDDLFVDVPGDACASSAPGVGRHVFFGSADGIVTTGNAISCDLFGCQNPDGDLLACPDQPSPVYGTSDAEQIGLGAGHDVVWAGAGDDVVIARFGHDTVFGGAGNDTLDGGPGRDVLIGGAGDDVFVIDASCEVAAGDVVDGGAGTDKVKSHLSQSELVALGVTFTQVEAFEEISEDGLGDATCVEGPRDDGPFVTPPVALSWTALPSPASTYTTTGDTLTLACANTSADSVDVALRFDLYVRGFRIPLLPSTFSVSANSTSNYTLELDSFVPEGVNPSEVDPALLVLPTSASLRVRGRLTVDGRSAGWAIGPTLYGHLEDEGETLVLYRDAALRSDYNDGDLAGLRAGGPTDSGPGIRLGRVETFGSMGGME